MALVTAIVLEYREKECALPWNNNRRIQRVMHFQIPLRSFEATVRLPPEAVSADSMFTESGRDNWGQRRQSSFECVASSSSPRSIPVSPIARKRVQLAFNNFSDDVLYQARDRLRKERAETLTGVRDLKVPRFNIRDCNEELYLTCGRHCVFKVLVNVSQIASIHVSVFRLVLECIVVYEGQWQFLIIATFTSRCRCADCIMQRHDVNHSEQMTACHPQTHFLAKYHRSPMMNPRT